MSKPERILEAALQVMADKGPYETTIDEIAQRAGVAKGTIYLYFKTKDCLMASLMQMGMDTLFSTIRRRVEAESDPLDQLHALIAEHVTQTYRHLTLGRMLWQQTTNLSLPPELKELFRLRALSYTELVSGILKRGQEAGCIEMCDAGVAARAILGSLNRAVFDFEGGEQSPTLETIIATLNTLIFNGVVKSGGK